MDFPPPPPKKIKKKGLRWAAATWQPHSNFHGGFKPVISQYLTVFIPLPIHYSNLLKICLSCFFLSFCMLLVFSCETFAKEFIMGVGCMQLLGFIFGVPFGIFGMR
jgi:hypothetical protein